MKRMKQIGVLLMALAMSTSLVGCGGRGNSGNGSGNSGSAKTTTIEFCNFLGCSGDEWIKQAAARFSALKKDESYEEGKTGVEVKVTQIKAVPYDTVDQSGYDILVGENKTDIYGMSKKNFLLNLDDIVKPLEGRIPDYVLEGLKGADGSYYGLPHYAWYTGISYDVGYFEEESHYFASPDSPTKRVVDNPFGTANFINGLTSTKSCGPNGEYGDYDDGLPSSLQEFMILCEEMKTQAGRTPFAMAGGCIDYAFFLADGLWASLAGPTQIQTIYSLDSEGETVDLVKLDDNGDIVYSNEIFYTKANGEKIMKPEIVKEPITEQNGYRIYDMESRYYALAFLEIALDRGWFNEDFYNSGASNISTQQKFLTQGSQEKTAMLYDASYWYSETQAAGNVKDYEAMYPGEGEPQVSYMCLPTQLEGQVTEGEGDKQALLDIGSAQIFVNKRVEESSGRERAVKEFLAFLYSDAELAAFTELTGYVRPIEYDYDGDSLDYYFQELNEIVEDSVVIYNSSESEIFKNNKAAFSLTWSGAINTVKVGTTTVTNGYLAAMRDYGATAAIVFNSTRKTKGLWASYLK